MGRLAELPLLVILMGIGAAAMYVPALHALVLRQHEVARAFFYPGTLFLVLTALIGLATISNRVRNSSRSHLLALLAAFSVLPAMLAVPLAEAVPDTSFANAWWEMVSAMTATGATLFDEPGRLPGSVHLWRAQVGWMGGFFVLVTAIALLEPMNLGGFEVLSGAPAGQGATEAAQITRIADPSERLVRFTVTLLPVYGGLTLLLWIGLIVAGDGALVALCHAMSTLSTSGISPVGGIPRGAAGLAGEMLVFVFLLFALTRRMYPGERPGRPFAGVAADPEFRLGLVIVGFVSALLFLRHWIGAYEVDGGEDALAAGRALWGAAFTVLSFLTTTGFESAGWADARAWSGLGTSGLILAGLAIIGGGVATTAGGVKLLRVYALYRHGEREMERLVHPSSIGGHGPVARRLRRQGAHMAWIFFMLFALSIAVVMVALSLAGLDFEPAMVLTISALSTTGPLAAVAVEAPVLWSGLDPWAKSILAAAMVLGRLETLAIIALLNPEYWRN